MGKALYRHYRTKSFSEVIGQEPITDTLTKALKSGRISHAYLLTGPKGVGKTSVARILAHEVNNLPYKGEAIHLDIIEIDAASNRRIDEIRDIREKVHIAPTSAKYKVYIIDEVHMLTKEAFNALLKTLEEPPEHCIFILATTEAHKLPETIISRTQRFTFKPVEKDKAIAHLKSIAKKEGIDIEADALELLAEHGGGSFRDSINMLDQLGTAGKKVTTNSARELLGVAPDVALKQLIEYISAGDSKGALNLLGEIHSDGTSPNSLAAQLGKKIRAELLAGTNYSWATGLLRSLLDVSSAKQPFEFLEIIILQAAHQNVGNQAPLVNKPEQLQAEPIETTDAPFMGVPELNSNFSLALWPEVIAMVKARAASLYTALRLAETQIDGNVLSLSFQFPLHEKKVKESRHIKFICDVIEELSGAKVEVHCQLSEKKSNTASQVKPLANSPVSEKSPKLTTINNIFGNAELLES